MTAPESESGQSPTPARDPAGYVVLGAFVEKVLDAQEARKSSIEARGLAVITTSGTLVTLLFGIVALATKREATYTLPPATQWFLMAAIAGLALAAGLGVATNRPVDYLNILPEELNAIVDEHWREDAWSAQARVTRTQATMATAAAEKNQDKARLLMWASGLEVASLVPLGIAVGLILVRS